LGLAIAKAAQAEAIARTLSSSPGRARERRAHGALDVTNEAGTRALFQDLDRIDHTFITAGSVALDAQLAPDSASLRPAMDVPFLGCL
jgi:hypothetical protein